MTSVFYNSIPSSVLSEYVHDFSNFLRNLNNNLGFNKIIQSVLDISDNNNFLHIVIADDDDDDKELFIEAMANISTKIKVSTATNGVDLLRMLHTMDPPDIIFLDLNMPVMNGFQCLNNLKQDPRLQYIPILIYSTSANLEQVEQTFLQGATRYIQKPNSFQDIYHLLKSILDLSPNQIFAPSTRNCFLLKAHEK